jgi:phosphoglycolate phosphatase
LYCSNQKHHYTPGVIQNIIFDWSGTLVDDLPAVWQATNYVLTQAGRPEMTLDQFRAEFCLPFTGFYERHLPHVPLPQLEAWFHHRYGEVRDSVGPTPYAREFLDFCRARGLRMFLLSTVNRAHFAAQSAATGLGGYIEKPYLEVWDKREKIHEILAENGLNPGATLFIGDMQHDIETAKHGGIHSCAVLTGYNTLDQLRTAGPDLIVEHLGELRERLERYHLELGPAEGQSAAQHPIATVGALIYDEAGDVLMVRTHKWSNLWGIPGGKIKWGEPAEDALRREIKEETDLDIANIEFVLVQDCIHSKEFYRDAHFILLNYTCGCAGRPPVRLNEEAREYRWLKPAEALTLALNAPTRRLLLAVMERVSYPVAGSDSGKPAKGSNV